MYKDKENNDNEAIISKLRKLKALVDRGVQGEAVNAKKLLFTLLEKYNLKYENIFDDEIRKDYSFSYSSMEEKKLFFNCVANIFGTNSEIWKESYRYKNGEMKFYLRLTKMEYILFNDFYEFHRKYWKVYIKKQMNLLMRAYIDSQNIYDISQKEENKEQHVPSASELKEMLAVMALSNQMKDNVPQYRKVIENK